MRDKRAWNPRPATLALVRDAGAVIADFQNRGYQLTLRQVYYQLVAQNRIPNTKESYKNLGGMLDRARWAQLIPMDALYDAGRQPEVPSHWESPEAALEALAQQYRTDPWPDDREKVEVWGEKDALKSVLGPLADEYVVAYQSCRGFMGLGALVAAAQRGSWQGLDIIYAGDHDPSGLAIDDDLQDRLDLLGYEALFERVALLPDQIAQYNLPPQPTKRGDSRSTSYLLAHGEGSWELDALDPDVLRGIVEDALLERVPDDWDDTRADDERVREELRGVRID